MKTRKKLTTGIILLMLSFACQGLAVDLTQYQSYLSSNNTTSATKKAGKSRSRQKQTNVPQIIPYQSESQDSSYYVQGAPGEYVPLSRTQPKTGESWLLPAETRVPKELTPLLSERLTPRQGLASIGGTGAVLVPSPGVLEPNKTAVGVHLQMFDLVNNSDVKYTDQDYFDTTISAAWGVEDGLEVGFDKTIDNQDRFDIEEPLYLNFKYQVPGNVTLGGSFNCNGGYHSTWVAAGVPVAWVGVGMNYGPSDYKFSWSNEPGKYHGRLKRAKFGKYSYDPRKATGSADDFFFFLGGVVPLNDYLRFLYDFNGDRFSLGFRFTYQNLINVNFSYVSEGDYDNLAGAITHKQYKGFILGASVLF
jgi:hypothetical protein